MSNLRILIVDDEPLARDGLRWLLEQEKAIEIVGECRDGTEAVKAIVQLRPDLVFLDIHMPGKNGLEVVRAIGAEQMPAVIFLTAYDKHALEAFRLHALDYLLKPVDTELFRESLAHARETLLNRQLSLYSRQLSALLQGTAPPPTEKTHDRAQENTPQSQERLVIKSGGHTYFLRTDEIYWVEASGDYITIHSGQPGAGGKGKYLVRETLSAIEQRLPAHRFQRIHRSAIVNLHAIHQLIANDSGDYQVVLHNGVELKLSRGYRDALYARLNPG